jgi:hypothetical protein
LVASRECGLVAAFSWFHRVVDSGVEHWKRLGVHALPVHAESERTGKCFRSLNL